MAKTETAAAKRAVGAGAGAGAGNGGTPAAPPNPVTNIADGRKAASAAGGAAAKEQAEKSKLAPLPPMPRARKNKPPRLCGCGCGQMTKGGAFIPGHDGRIKGWALRVERGVVKLKDIPEGERDAVKRFMLEKKKAVAAAGKGDEGKLNTATVADVVETEGGEGEEVEGAEEEGTEDVEETGDEEVTE